MKLSQVTEMAQPDLQVSLRRNRVDLKYGKKRMTIFNISRKNDEEFIFTPSKDWDNPSMTTKAKSAKEAYSILRKKIEQHVFSQFGHVSPNAERAVKKLGI